MSIAHTNIITVATIANNPPRNARLEHALLYFNIFFAVLLTLPQLIRTLLALGVARHKPDPDENYAHRRPFLLLILFTTCALLASYATGAAVAVSQFEGTTFMVGRAVNAMQVFSNEAASEALYAGLLGLLVYRASVQYSPSSSFSPPSPPASSPAPSPWPWPARKGLNGRTRTISIALLLLTMVICSTTRAVIDSTVAVGVKDNILSSRWWTASSALYHVYLGIYLILTFVIVVWSTLLWKNDRACFSNLQPSSLELYLFDNNVLRRIVELISPFIAIRALFKLVSDIIVNHEDLTSKTSTLGLELATVIIEGGTFFIVVAVALRFGCPSESGGRAARVSFDDADPYARAGRVGRARMGGRAQRRVDKYDGRSSGEDV
ncbi:hypothetical protein AX17_004209 [Amanita inopinata Kibby_2008]|nr:hypothetical protein AX17_004346 [Amanita inopinata Kibby_2008]KAF8634364.1 hypothetical protein AX17_004209 [Amanita inopinata Kibby_2008]